MIIWKVLIVKAVFSWLKSRAAEPSTSAGFAAVLVAVAPVFPEYQNIILGAAVALGGVAVIKKDQ